MPSVWVLYAKGKQKSFFLYLISVFFSLDFIGLQVSFSLSLSLFIKEL